MKLETLVKKIRTAIETNDSKKARWVYAHSDLLQGLEDHRKITNYLIINARYLSRSEQINVGYFDEIKPGYGRFL